jgi:hypothetical protein
MYSTTVKASLLERFTNVSKPTFLAVVTGLISLLVIFGMKKQKETTRKTDFLLHILIPSFILEFIFSEISGFHFPQYSMTLSLFVCMIFGYAFFKITDPYNKTENGISKNNRMNQVIFLITLIFVGLTTNMVLNRAPLGIVKAPDEEAKKWIDTRPTLFMWGAEAVVNYILDKPAPTRFVYQLPLMNDRYCTDEKGKELLHDIQVNLPIIIDASASSPWMPALDPIQRDETIAQKSYIGNLNCLEDFFHFFETHYKEVHRIPRFNWIVYSPQ